jgi:hypothetical protein
MPFTALQEFRTYLTTANRRSTRSLACLFAFILLPCAQELFSQSKASNEKGNPISATLAGTSHDAPQVKLRLAETVSSANAKVGQIVVLEVVDPVQVDGRVVIAAGAPAQASVTTAKRRGHNQREGQLVLTVSSVSRTDGGEALLRSTTVQKGSGHGEPIFGPCTFPLPADPAGLFRKGQDVVIPKGTELTAAIASGNP